MNKKLSFNPKNEKNIKLLHITASIFIDFNVNCM